MYYNSILAIQNTRDNVKFFDLKLSMVIVYFFITIKLRLSNAVYYIPRYNLCDKRLGSRLLNSRLQSKPEDTVFREHYTSIGARARVCLIKNTITAYSFYYTVVKYTTDEGIFLTATV